MYFSSNIKGKGLGVDWKEGHTLEEDRKVEGGFGIRTRVGTSFQAKNGHLSFTPLSTEHFLLPC